MARRMSSRELRAWLLHMHGHPVSSICALTGLAALHVRSIVTGVRFDDKMAAHNAG